MSDAPLTEALLYRYERLDGGIYELVPASLARALERHCEAMAAALEPRSIYLGCKELSDWQKWKAEQLGK